MRGQLAQARAETTAEVQEISRLKAAVQQGLTNQALAAQARPAIKTNSNSKPSGLMAPLAEMLKNPETKQMIKDQQKNVIGPMIDKNYGKLFADLRLTAEQASALKEMILNKQLSAADMGMSMLSGDATQRKELGDQIKAAGDAADAQIKQFLGDDNFAQLQAYEKTMGERTTVTQLRDQLASGPAALSDEQAQRLIDAMAQERQNFKFTTDFSDKSKFNGDFASMLTEDKMNTYFQELSALDDRYLAQAQTFLTSDQLAAFKTSLNSQQAMQKAGMQMAVKMFAPAKDGGE
jgi:hypothetical protein